MIEKLKSLEEKYEEISHLLADPKVMEDQKEYQKHAKAHSALEDIVTVYRQFTRVLQEE
ncbi:MAG TPA: PCRF domain-containing protein, partial [Clostridia bacterium]|nr:PCRF domain-containing protein [Clostridia bacterium]